MISSVGSNNNIPRTDLFYTLVSTFEKANSLSFKLLFGQPRVTRMAPDGGQENLFRAGQIFGLECRSTGKEFQKFHHILVLRACDAGEGATVVPGVNPGAEVLVETLTNKVSLSLISIFKKLELHKINLEKISQEKYYYLNQLLLSNMKTDFFVGELIEQTKNA